MPGADPRRYKPIRNQSVTRLRNCHANLPATPAKKVELPEQFPARLAPPNRPGDRCPNQRYPECFLHAPAAGFGHCNEGQVMVRTENGMHESERGSRKSQYYDLGCHTFAARRLESDQSIPPTGAISCNDFGQYFQCSHSHQILMLYV